MNTPDPTTPYATGGPITPPAPGMKPPPDNSWITMDAAPKRRSRLPWILGAAAAVLFLLVLTVVITLAASGDGNNAAKAPSAWDREQSANAAPVAEPGVPTTEPAAEPTAGPVPAVKDFALRAKITDKECFGSAGCSVTIKVQAEYGGPVLSADDTWEVTYEVRGVQDGPVIGSFEMTGDTYTVNEEYLSTASSKSKITIKVTSVDKVGL